ncbi:MAG: phosphatase PAP2 family protein [Anaeromyxobacter sp.]
MYTALEERLFRALNADGGPWLDRLATLFAPEETGIAFGLLLALALLSLPGREVGRAERARRVVALGLAVTLSDLLGNELMRPLIGRMRPNHALEAVRQLAPGRNVGSLPSLHAANYAAMATVAFAGARWLGLLAAGVAALAAWSRVYVGVHWPTDVLAGAAWGVGWALVSLQVTRGALRAWVRRRC